MFQFSNLMADFPNRYKFETEEDHMNLHLWPDSSASV